MTVGAATLVIAALEVVAALGIVVFWVSWFRQPHDEEWLPEGYVQHERVFVFPDSVLALLLVASAILLVLGHPLGRTLSLVCAGMLAFLGLIDAAYFWQTGLFARRRGGFGNAAVVVVVLALGLLLVASFARGGERAPVTFEGLLEELADLDRLAVHPGGAWTQLQASSHDPRNGEGFSRLGRPWGFANVDFGNYLRRESVDGRQEWVLVDEEGPGVITRWWSVGIDDDLLKTGTFRVYVDDAREPVLEATAFDLVGRDGSGFGPALNFGTPERGGNLYAPIPYGRRVQVTWDGPTTHGGKDVASRDPALEHSADSALWYNVNLRRYDEGARVAAFTPTTVLAARDALAAVNGRLSPASADDLPPATATRLANGDAVSRRFTGPGAIRHVRARVTGEDPVAALHQTSMVLVFDGQETARVPLAQFFGNGASEGPENPLNVGGDRVRRVHPGGDMTSSWVMPYRETAEVRVVNESGQDVDLVLEVEAGDWTWDEWSLHFHADYRAERGIRTRSAGDAPWPGVAGKRELYSAEGDADFRFIDIRGRGVYVGDTLSIRNRSTGGGLNAWWGEGDEKIYVDYLDASGDGSTAAPDHRGTGTEDYYGYSFGSGREFTSPFVTQPIAAGNRTDDGALTVNGRVRGLDAIPFDESFKFDMELWKWREGRLDVEAATFWYGRPGAVSLSVVADLAVDYGETAERGWRFFSADQDPVDGTGTALTPLAWGRVGEQDVPGHEAPGCPGGSPAVSDTLLSDSGRANDPVSGSGPGYHELVLRPGGEGCAFVVARWVADDSSAGRVNLGGVIRNLVAGGDGPEFSIAVGGRRVFQASPREDGTLPETAFDLDVEVEAGQPVDFILGNGGRGDARGDESVLRAIVRAARR